MDFSTDERALRSLLRRQPPVTSPSILETTQKLLDIITTTSTSPSSSDDDDYESLILTLCHLGQSDRWEALAVGLHLSISHLNSSTANPIYPEGPRVPTLQSPMTTTTTTTTVVGTSFSSSIVPILLSELEHHEPRVRTLVAKGIGAHASASGDSETYGAERLALYDAISRSLYEHLETGRLAQKKQSEDKADGGGIVKDDAVDDTTGWRALETSLHALAAFLAGQQTADHDPPSSSSSSDPLSTLSTLLLPTSSPTLSPPTETKKLIAALQTSSISHVNRHVRAASLNAWDRLISSPSFPPSLLSSEPLFSTLQSVLEVTLADNWSQVRMAASVLCRALFSRLSVEEKRLYYPVLLPRMCLNRFYLAQGVKLYSQETWRMVMGEEGMSEVARNAGGVVRYYVKMCDADNHVVREAACQAVAELASKIGTHPVHSPSLAPFVPLLLQALITCFYDESWPVRDEACLACGTFVRSYPTPSHPELSHLYTLWMTHLTDQIWSVRRDAAVALGEAMRAYPREVIPQVVGSVRELLPYARKQEKMTREEYEALQNDEARHTGSQLYSCGSLAPKLKKRHTGGCSDCVVDREKQPWEASDGCLYLIAELCGLVGECDEDGKPLLGREELHGILKEMIDVCQVNHFPQSDDLRMTLWRNLPDMARRLGKKVFKRTYLELFLPMVVRNARSRTASRLSVHAAKTCLVELGEVVGEGILRGRLELMGEGNVWDDCRGGEGMGGMGNGGMMMSDDGFGPFGPPGPMAVGGMGRFP